MSTRRELVNNLVAELESRDFYEEVSDIFNEKFKFDADFAEALNVAISDDAISKMTELIQSSNYESASDVYNDFKRLGLFSVTPAIIRKSENDIPSLMLGINHYLHWFRGYHFQISNTHDGQYEHYAGADRLDNARAVVRYVSDAEAAEKFVTVGCLIPVLCHFDQGRKLLKQNTELVNEFINTTYNRVYHDSCDTDSFMKYIMVEERSKLNFPDDFPEYTYTAVRLMEDDVSYGLLLLYKDHVTLLTRCKSDVYRVSTLSLPEWFDDFRDDDFYGDVQDGAIVCKIAIRALLALSGFRADYMCMYAIGTRRGDMLPLDYYTVDTAKSWEDIEKYIYNAVL